MTPEEIREIAIDSAEAYYDYLEQNEKGIQEVDVFDLEYLKGKDTILKLRLSAKLFDTEAIFFKNLRNNKKYDTTSIRVIEYDNDKNILLIKPDENVKADFWGISKTDIKVISDLKFLIQRVKAWYELNGSKISLPTKVSKHSNDYLNIEFFKDKNLQPSENQKQSLASILKNPFSYVWGAPGTGKTQFVLSYAVLHYIMKGDKIAILAPTNNAIEQVLKGVIKMTDKAGIDRKQIIRLGTPSKKFAEEFPEVCEEKGVQKKIAEIDGQISILERMLNFQNQKKGLDGLNSLIAEFEKLYELSNKLELEMKVVSEINSEHKKMEIEVKLLHETVLNQNQKLNKVIAKTNSISYKIAKAFSRKITNTESEIAALELKILNLKRNLEYSKYELSEISYKRIARESSVKEIQELESIKIQNLKNRTKDNLEVNAIVSSLSTENLSKIKENILLIIDQKNKDLEVDQHLFNEYKGNSLLDIKSELNVYLSMRSKLLTSSTLERLESVSVIACTLDGYIGRYLETKLNVEHIFLDEAGYANIIKALTLFNHTTPITFLGDHKQLPPVCEINDINIERDKKLSNMFLWAQSAIFLESLFSNSSEICKKHYIQNRDFIPQSIKKTSLNSTYRFGSNLAKILAKHVYTNEFNSCNSDGETKILTVNAKKTEGLNSRISMNEVLEISRIVTSLKLEGNFDFVILTPYKKQIKLLNNFLPQERNDLKILTVHGSQGREWNTVILSIVDTSDKWFVDSTIPISKGLNLVNTAVSRAKRNLIIVCDKNYWAGQKGQLITELINCQG